MCWCSFSVCAWAEVTAETIVYDNMNARYDRFDLMHQEKKAIDLLEFQL